MHNFLSCAYKLHIRSWWFLYAHRCFLLDNTAAICITLLLNRRSHIHKRCIISWPFSACVYASCFCLQIVTALFHSTQSMTTMTVRLLLWLAGAGCHHQTLLHVSFLADWPFYVSGPHLWNSLLLDFRWSDFTVPLFLVNNKRQKFSSAKINLFLLTRWKFWLQFH